MTGKNSTQLQGKMDGVTGVVGNPDFASLMHESSLMLFDSGVLTFLGELSQAILKSRPLRTYPEMIAFAYWMRTARVQELKKHFLQETGGKIRVPRGLVFHIAPANVDTIFLYSLILSMLAGNKNIVRVSSRDSEQVSIVLHLMNDLLVDQRFHFLFNRLAVVQYARDAQTTEKFSSLCDVRVIWGGNTSAKAIRALPLSPYATELVFADKISLAVFDAAALNKLPDEDKATLARQFVNDSYAFGQMACSSPHLVVWRGAKADVVQASARFWDLVEAQLAKAPPDISIMDIMNKLVSEQRMAVASPISIRHMRNNALAVSTLANLSDFNRDECCGGGFFAEARIDDLEELKVIVQRNVQTIVSAGIPDNEWRDFLTASPPLGIDRIVAPGQALTFAKVWDGFDFLREFTREISLDV